ncbi:MAG: M24 family metallopeptidase [Christensenellaceae bacterium]|jgi:Xaa-Pro dipeptidase
MSLKMYEMRIARVQEKLKKRGFLATVVSEEVSVEYLIDRHISHLGERLMALMIPAEGKPVLFINALFPIAESPLFDIVYHSDSDVATKDLAAALPSGIIGIDRFLMAQFLIELLEARGDITPKVGSFAVEEVRMIKDSFEQDAMRKASKICDDVFSHIPGLLKEGMTELELAEEIRQLFFTLGDPRGPVEPLVCFDAGSAEPHHTNNETQLKAGDVVLIDAGQTTFGYTSDMTRTFFYQSITEEQKKVYEIVCEANRLAREKIAPGIPFSEVDAAARDYITKMGYGEYFTHRTGHNIGRQMHEEPSVSAVNHMPIEAGMTFSIEPGIYMLGKFGVRIEDIVLVTENGAETLNAYSKEIQVIG